MNVSKISLFGTLAILLATPVIAEPGDRAGDHAADRREQAERDRERQRDADYNDAGRGVRERERADDNRERERVERLREIDDSVEATQREIEDAQAQEDRERPDPESYGDSGGPRLPEKERPDRGPH